MWSGGSPSAASQTSEDEDNAWIWLWPLGFGDGILRGLGLLHRQGGGALGGGDLSASSRADDVRKEGKMQTNNTEDVFKMLDEIEFPEMVEPSRAALEGMIQSIQLLPLGCFLDGLI